jgi:hypothetical protein
VLASATALTALVLTGCGTTSVTTASSTGAPALSAKASSGVASASASGEPAEVKRIAAALEPLRTAQDFVPGKVQDRLTGLGYASGKLTVHQNGSTGVSNAVDLAPVCLEGTMSLTEVRTVAHGGYSDGTGCSMPRGGH